MKYVIYMQNIAEKKLTGTYIFVNVDPYHETLCKMLWSKWAKNTERNTLLMITIKQCIYFINKNVDI